MSKTRGDTHGDTPRRRSRWTLARRLSTLSVGLMALIVLLFTAAGYGSVREQAILRSSERVANVTRELATGAARSAAARSAALAALARDSVIQRVLSATSTDVTVEQRASRTLVPGAPSARRSAVPVEPPDASLASVFASRRRAGDSTFLGWQLWDAAGTRRFGATLQGRDSAVLSAAIALALQQDSATRSPIYVVGSHARLWSAVPIRREGRVVGVLAEQRRIVANAQIEGIIKRLSGQDARVYFTSRDRGEWATVLGTPTVSPFDVASFGPVPDTGAVRRVNTPSGALSVAIAPVAGTPWQIVLTQREAAILARPQAVLRQLVGMGAVLLLIGAAGAWWLSTRETRPLTELRRASQAMAAGDYAQRVGPGGAEDMAALAEAFNTMARRIGEAHAELEERTITLERSNEAKARFLAVMSHELRTPLNAIGGHAELVSVGVHGPLTPAQRDAMERIGRCKDQLLHLVNDILQYARLEAAPLLVSSESVAVQAVFDAVQESVADRFARKGISLLVAPTEATVCADPVRVQQVLANLVTNALEFTERGGRVWVSAVASGAWTTLLVRDTGMGITAEQQRTIFEPFVQGDSSLTRRTGGSGLGLAIVRQLVTAMGGGVSVESTPGVGSTFSVELPAADRPPIADEFVVRSTTVAIRGDTPVPPVGALPDPV